MPPRGLLAIFVIIIMLGIGQIPFCNTTTNEVLETIETSPVPLTLTSLDEDSRQRVTISFERELTRNEIDQFESIGVSFGMSPRHIGTVYLVEVTQEALNAITKNPLYRNAEPLRTKNLESTRDVSVVETYSDIAWTMKDLQQRTLTGKDILIADLDTGIQWRHPDFFHADGGLYAWTDSNTNSQFDNGTDGIEFNNDFTISANETLYTIDTNNNGNFDVDIDWIWLDNGTSIGSIDDGDTFFVVADTNGNNILNVGENLVALMTPKTKYIIEKNLISVDVWERGVNLTSSTHYDTDGHGTGVAGILNGGQLGYRKFVGIAPDADLLAIDIFGTNSLTVEEGLILARDYGADVILIEIGAWSYLYLDGSSNVEIMINTLTQSGIPVVVPAGNLGGAARHVQQTGFATIAFPTQFVVPTGLNANELYITVLCTKDMSQSQITIVEPTSTGSIVHSLNPGVGYDNWQSSPVSPNVTIDSFVSSSTRATFMLAIDIRGTIMDTQFWTINIMNPNAASYNFYISDDVTGWSGGAQWNPAHGLNDLCTITWPSTADQAISVASYMSRNLWSPGYGWLAPYSSMGPRVDNNPKMSISAPGGWDIVSPWSSDSAWASWMTGVGGLPLYPMFGGFQLFSGTSAAGPHVAGAIALMLQLNNDCGSLAKFIIEASAYTDGYTGILTPWPGAANTNWGFGKLNISRAIEETRKLPRINDIDRTPDSPQYSDSVSITANITNTDFVEIWWTNSSWSSQSQLNMTLSGGIYSSTIPTHSFGTDIDYIIKARNASAITSLDFSYSYVVDDRVIPILTGVTNNMTTIVYDNMFVEVNASVSEPSGASGLASVVLEVSFDNWVTVNTITMTGSAGQYTGTISPVPVGLTARFHVKATDNAGNVAQSSDYFFVTQGQSTTTTTTTTSRGLVDLILDNLTVVIGATVGLLLILMILLRRRR
ncbi:MAG: S8 family serine peptidase [Candidatus Thorarchaeota archaeon]|nr:S8 family serine peptidase [Candidatus Thorarchaeota archaeon]